MMPDNATKANGLLDVRSLREQLYGYIRSEIQSGQLIPGALINLNEISERLGISKTPLRDALIQLECEGFVTILPRRGVMVNTLTLDEIQNVLEIVGSLESTVIASVFERIKTSHLTEMKHLNEQMRKLVQKKAFNDAFDQRYYQLNIAFHDIFLNLSRNSYLQRIIMPIKQRLYDFPRLSYIREWELINCDEHDQLVQYIKNGKRQKAVRLWQDSHWSFKAHERYIREFYFQGSKQIQYQLERQEH